MTPARLTPAATLLAATLLLAACDPATPSATPSATTSPATASAGPSSVDTPEPAATNNAPQGLLVAIRSAAHPGYDRLVLEFGGAAAPTCRIEWVDEVRHDPSDRLITLSGKAFLRIACDGATLDTSPRESDPAKVRRYAGPTRVTPNLQALKEIAVAGDFEGVLSFGIGVDHRTEYHLQTLTAPARLVVDLPR